MKKSLEEISQQYRSDKGAIYHNYLEIYEKYFSNFSDKILIISIFIFQF